MTATLAEAQLDHDFREALTAAAEKAGVQVLPGYGMPWLQAPGATDGGYWIGMGLEHWSHIPASQWRTFLFASWVSEADDDFRIPRCLDVYLSGESARDPVILAAMAVTAVTADLAKKVRHGESAGPVGPGQPPVTVDYSRGQGAALALSDSRHSPKPYDPPQNDFQRGWNDALASQPAPEFRGLVAAVAGACPGSG